MRTQFSRGTIVAKRSDLALKGPGACLQATGPLPLLTLHRRALRNEYVTGESVCGGAGSMSEHVSRPLAWKQAARG